MIDLTIRLRENPDAAEQEFRLAADNGLPRAESTLANPEAALAALEKYGEDIFFPQPGPPRLCTQQYGGPQVAMVSGTYHGRQVNAVFTRTDGCEISRWRAMEPLFGAVGTFDADGSSRA